MSESEEDLLFTVASVWREERVSCPHPNILTAHLSGSLDEAASAFVKFHLVESQCPYCNAVVEDLRVTEAEAQEAGLEDMKERLLRSTVAELKRANR